MSSARNQQHEVGHIAGIPIVIDAEGFDAEFLALMTIPKASDTLAELKSHNHVLGFFTNKITTLMASTILLDEQIKNRNALTKKMIEVSKSFLFLTSEDKKSEVHKQLIDGIRQLENLLKLEMENLRQTSNVGDFLDRSIHSINSVLNQVSDSSSQRLYREDFEQIKKNMSLVSSLFEMVTTKKDEADKQLGELARELILLKFNIQWMSPYLPVELIQSNRWDEEFHPVALNQADFEVADQGTPSISQQSTAPVSRRGSQPDIPVVTIRTSPAVSVSNRFYQPPPPKPVVEAPLPPEPEATPTKKCCCVIL